MKKFLILLICVFSILQTTQAKKIKAGVVVFGANAAGLAAAIQSAHSGVETVLIDEGYFTSVTLNPADTTNKAGVYWDLLNRIDSLKKKSTSPVSLTNSSDMARVFKGWTDTIKNLSVFTNVRIKKIKKDGRNWEIELTDGRELKPDVVIDATPGNQAAKMAGFSANGTAPAAGAYTNKLFRTGLAAIESTNYPATLPVSALLTSATENLILLGTPQAPATILTGQAAGATGAFCAFYNTTTKNLNVRVIQGELLVYKTQLLSFEDVALTDSTFAAIQRIAITGIMKGSLSEGKFLFRPEETVSAEDIRLSVREYFSRSQIWFLDNNQDKLTLGDALSLIKFTAARADELDREVERGWNSSLKLSGKFDPAKVITRRELAVLMDRYMRPFDRRVDLQGNLKI